MLYKENLICFSHKHKLQLLMNNSSNSENLSFAPAENVQLVKLHSEAVIPEYKKSGDSGFDLCCIEPITIKPGEVAIIHTGIALAIPEGFEVQIRMRSGASLNTPLIIPNAPATIDSGYRGELGIIVRNIGDAAYTVKKGERIAQGVLMPVIRAQFCEVEKLPESDRGASGYGSTGRFR